MERDSRKIVKRLLQEGFERISISGSHHKFRKGALTVIVPPPEEGFAGGNCAGHCKAGRLDLPEVKESMK